ncbi:MAG: hypothetical protein QFB87_04690 [Patescibacteria group bacterium]|nr:hypothetical protein [Patescibacteria group bacterium]
MDNRLYNIGQNEVTNHLAEAERLKELAQDLLTSAEYHLRQASKWQDYLGSLACTETTERPNLTLIHGNAR